MTLLFSRVQESLVHREDSIDSEAHDNSGDDSEDSDTSVREGDNGNGILSITPATNAPRVVDSKQN
jgi:hypothetical protein